MKTSTKLLICFALFCNYALQANAWETMRKVNKEVDKSCPHFSYANRMTNIQKSDYILDSILMYVPGGTGEQLKSKGISYYNEANLESHSLVYLLSNGKWRLNAKDTTVYDDRGNKISYVYSAYNLEAAAIIIKNRELNVYDASNRLIERCNDVFNPTIGEWQLGQKILFTYDGEGRLTKATYQDWQMKVDKYITHFQEVYRDFNTFGKPLYAEGSWFKSVELGAPEDQWIDATWDTLQYDDRGNLTRRFRYMGTTDGSGIRKPASAENWKYNENNQEIEYINYLTYVSGGWAPRTKTETTYNAEGYIDYFVDYTYSSVWNRMGRYQYFWSELGREPEQFDIGVLAITEPTTASSWTNQETIIIEVKNFGTTAVNNIPVVCMLNNTRLSGVITSEILPGTTLTYTFTEKADMSKLSAYNLTAYTNLPTDSYRKNDTCRKSVQKVSIEDGTDMKIRIYPNPAVDYINIESADAIRQITLYTVWGQKIVEMEGGNLNTQTLSLSSLVKGVYILIINTNTKVERRKISVLK